MASFTTSDDVTIYYKDWGPRDGEVVVLSHGWPLNAVSWEGQAYHLAASGFPLTGGRLDYIDGHPAAALVYQRAQHVINVFVWPQTASDGRGDQVQTIRGFHARHWTRDGMTFWAVSDLNDAELSEFEQALRQ